jgi:hypothetical protein
MTLTRILATSALALTACGGEANLGDDAAEAWSNPSEDAATRTEATTLYRGGRLVGAFLVREGTLYALLGARLAGQKPAIELLSCPVDDCANQRRTLWTTSDERGLHGVVEPLALSSRRLFWVIRDQLMSCPIEDCQDNARTLGSPSWSREIGADSDFVYWLDAQQRLVRCPHDGCVTDEVVDPSMPAASVIATGGQIVPFGDSIYSSYDNDRKIVRWDRETEGTPEVLYESVFRLSEFDVRDDGVYFGTNMLTGSMVRCPLSGACGKGEVLVEAQRWPTVVRVTSSAVVWVNAIPEAAAFMRLAPGGKAAEIAPQSGRLGSVIVSDGYLYWAESSLYDDVDQIRRVAL